MMSSVMQSIFDRHFLHHYFHYNFPLGISRSERVNGWCWDPFANKKLNKKHEAENRLKIGG